mgnify:CR=1 FL=1
MNHQVVIFEDAGWRRLYPITLSRPTFDCRVGAATLGRRLTLQLGRRDLKRVDFLCREQLRPGVEREYAGHGVNREAGEDVRAHAVPLSGLSDWLALMQSKGMLVDPKVFAGASLVRQEMDEWTYD